VYRAKLIRVVDGDTVYLEVDCGFRLKTTHSFRILGIDTPELRGGTLVTKADARAAKHRTQALLEAEEKALGHLLISTSKADSFGRWLCFISLRHLNSDLGAELLKEGHAVPYTK